MKGFQHRLRIVGACGALAFVSWRGALSLYDGGVEMRRWSLVQRRYAWSASAEERLQRALGDDFALWRALDEHVPSREMVVVVYPREHGATREEFASGSYLQRLQRLRAVACPRLLTGVSYDARHPGDLDPRQVQPMYLLDLDSGCDLSLLPRMELLARGKNFTLVHVGGKAP